MLSWTPDMPSTSREALWISGRFYMLDLVPFSRRRYAHGYGWTNTEHATLIQLGLLTYFFCSIGTHRRSWVWRKRETPLKSTKGIIRRLSRATIGSIKMLSWTPDMPSTSREALWISGRFYMLDLVPFSRRRYAHGYGWTNTEHATLIQLGLLSSKNGSIILSHFSKQGTPSSSMPRPTISMGTCACQFSGTPWLQKRSRNPST